jgi:ABC-type transporter Mla maintaining outer membrane lipid asymmetry ATPase subunit MlaF
MSERASTNPETVLVIEMEDVVLGSLQEPAMAFLEGVNWRVRAGDYWAVAGLHRAGKSDLLMMTGGLMAPLAGRYRLFGNEMPIFEGSLLNERLRLGLVFDGGQLLHGLTVRENIALPIRYHRNLTEAAAKPEVEAILNALELAPFADQAPGMIGRNWQKRVGLARALMLKPELLLLDNPIGGLDPRHVSWWLDFLGELSVGHNLFGAQPLTLVVTTSDLRPWKDRARLFALLNERRFTVLGSWAQVEAAKGQMAQDLWVSDRKSK